jgi:uncharacterized protein
MTILYHEGNRRIQDQFDSRRIADRLEQVTTRTAFTDADKTFIESQCFFFLATTTAEGHPTCNLKARAGFAIPRVGTKKRDSRSNKETDQESKERSAQTA